MLKNSAIKDFILTERMFKPITEKLKGYLAESIYLPIFNALSLKLKAKNSESDIIDALDKGLIYYENGVFKAKKSFSNRVAKTLEELGAKWSKRYKGYVLDKSKIPARVLTAMAINLINFERKCNFIIDFLNEVENNLEYFVEQMVFNEEVIDVLDESGNIIKKNARTINVVEYELTEQQKAEIARDYTNNMQFYIKGWAKKRIPLMREKVRDAVINGYREDYVQELLEKEFKIASDKAKFLAQNETSIMLAEFKKTVYKEMGFTHFIWNTIIDGLERPEHKKLNNTVWSFDNPPIIDERSGARGLPGETYNCRCGMIPVRPESPFFDKSKYKIMS